MRLAFRTVGAEYSTLAPGVDYLVLSDAFDGLLFIDETTAITLLSAGDSPGATALNLRPLRSGGIAANLGAMGGCRAEMRQR